MSEEARKLHLIETILRIEDASILEKIENLLKPDQPDELKKKTFKDFAGIWTEEEAEEIKKIIEEGCEQIDPHGWK